MSKADNSHQWEERCKLTFQLKQLEPVIVNNLMFFVDNEKCEQVTIEFISDKRYLVTIYVNADNKVVNDYITNYFANLPLDKNYVIADRLNNVETFY